MEFNLSDRQKEFKRIAKKFSNEVLKDKVKFFDENQQVPTEIIKQLYDHGFGAITIEEEYNGLGCGMLDFAVVIEEISKVCGSTALTLIGSSLGAIAIDLYGNESQKKKYLPDIADGKKLATFAVSESSAGSDISSMKTIVEECDDKYIMNGSKCWITNAEIADIYVVLSKGKGDKYSTFIVEKEFEGFKFGKKEDKLGMRSSSTGELIFQNCIIPKENLLYKSGEGMHMAGKILNYSRPIIGAQALGIAEGAFEDSIRYAKERKQFGKSISSFQIIKHILVDMYTEIEAARWLVYNACKKIDDNDEDIQVEASISKVFASNTAMKVTTNAIQILGGYGYIKEYPMEKRMRDAKVTQIYEGTNQILNNLAAKSLLNRY
ncbi:acyl-CoA dehydrogenase family protein [Clostridium akagii]|uniref:acyl-CoA dehydrogenase family protein n=1 Tax=Clostridium akagii TaxID=91623 RepID=UPI00047BC897|nr:acyl-CoA dehydrogenase family protein [Clostridium akagii]